MLFVVFHFVEEALVGRWHGTTLLASLNDDAHRLKVALVASLIFASGLIPLFAFREMARALEATKMRRLLFKDGGVAEVLGPRATPPTEPRQRV